MRNLLIGGGAFAREILCMAQDAAACGGFDVPTEYVDDGGATLDGFDYSLSYLGKLADIELAPGDKVLISIGDPVARAKIVAALPQGIEARALVHPSAVIARTAKIMRGAIIGPHSYVSADALVGEFTMINSSVGVGHDVIVGACVTISSQVDLMGKVKVHDGAFLGSGARILPGLEVGASAKIGAGSVVVRSVQPGATVFAAPARKL